MRLHLRNRLRPAFMRSVVLKAHLLTWFLLLGVGQVCFGQTPEEVTEEIGLPELQAYYRALDPRYSNMAAQLPNLQSALGALNEAVAAARTALPNEFESQFADCSQAIDTAIRRAAAATQADDRLVRYGSVQNLLSPDLMNTNGALWKVLLCVKRLNRELGGNPRITEAAARLSSLYTELDREFMLIDEKQADKRGKEHFHRLMIKRKKGSGGAANPRAAGNGVCERNVHFQNAKYKVRNIRVEDPFDFLPWVGDAKRDAEKEIAALVKGKPFLYETAVGEASDIVARKLSLPDTSANRVKLQVEVVSVENCSDGELDIVYRIYSTRILRVLSGMAEARATERQTPQTAAGQTTAAVPSSGPVYLIPKAGYDSVSKLFGGGRLEITPKDFGNLPFKSAIVEGLGSSAMKSISATLSGSTDSETGRLAHAEWLLNYSNYSLPTGAGQLKGGHLSGQFAGTSKPFGEGNFTLRFGGLLEGGNRQSSVRDAPLTPETLANAGFGSLKLYTGLNARLRHHVLSVSYGLELGSVGPATRVDWRKHIGDVRHVFWYSLGDHRILDLESRFTVGRIQVPGRIPLSERFFGGNNEEFFIPSDEWQIRANPVIRAIPGSNFYRTADGAGGERFFSYNLTAAYAVWRKTLIPQELTDDPEFQSEVQEAIDTVTNNLQNVYATKDPAYKRSTDLLPPVLAALERLRTAITAAQASRPDEFETEFKNSLRAINMAVRRANGAAQAADVVGQYGNVRALLSPSAEEDENRLAKVMANVTDLNTKLGNDSAITTAVAELDAVRQNMEREFGQIDELKAAASAKADMAFTRRTLNTLFNDVNIYSLSPVFVFDIAKISRQRAGFGGVRYGPGLGLRLEFASVAHFTSGYAWNVRRGPGEGHGTVFFSIGVRDLFH